MPNVRFEQVRKVFANGQVAVADATFQVNDGELVTLVGPSGCGKSTLLRLLAGLEQPTGGRIHIGDQDVTHVAPKDRDIAMVFQSYALYPHMTVAENLEFALKLRDVGAEERRARVRAAADTLELGALLERRPSQLSGGQRQRVALGRALVRQPKVFLLDEPLSNLDARLRTSMRAEIARLHRRLGATMVYVTHDQVEAMTLGQRIVVLRDGVIQQIDTPLAVYHQPANVFVAGFIGSPAMNLFKGRFERAPQPALTIGTETLPLPPAAVHPALPPGQDCILGIRPEELVVQPPDEAAGPGRMTGVVDTLELIGNEILVGLRFAGEIRVARAAPSTRVSVGDRLTLSFGAERLHWFDAGSGQRISA